MAWGAGNPDISGVGVSYWLPKGNRAVADDIH